MSVEFQEKKVFHYSKDGKKVTKVISKYRLSLIKLPYAFEVTDPLDITGFLKQYNLHINGYSCFFTIQSESRAICNPEDEYDESKGTLIASLRNDYKVTRAIEALMLFIEKEHSKYVTNIRSKLHKKTWNIATKLETLKN